MRREGRDKPEVVEVVGVGSFEEPVEAHCLWCGCVQRGCVEKFLEPTSCHRQFKSPSENKDRQ